MNTIVSASKLKQICCFVGLFVFWVFFVTAKEHAPMSLEAEIKAGSYGS